jgi:hypothetical protein
MTTISLLSVTCFRKYHVWCNLFQTLRYFLLKWTVVEFLNEENKEISTIPCSCVGQADDMALMCYWPPQNYRKHIRCATQPKPTWETFSIKLLLACEGTYVICLIFLILISNNNKTVLISLVSYDETIAYEKKVCESESEANISYLKEKIRV